MHTLLSALLFIAIPDSTDAVHRSDFVAAVQAYAQPFDTEWDSTVVRVEWTDLSSDGHDDAFVYLAGPAWCGSGGCTVLVFETMSEEDAVEWGRYRPAAEISLMHGPIHVAQSRTEGWHDLIVQSEDGSLRTLRFDGETYPFSPGDAPAWSGRQPAGQTFFADAQ